MDSIKNILPDIMGKMSAGPAGAGRLQEAWSRAAGAGSRAAELKEGCLVIHVDSSMRMVKLNLDKTNLLQRISKEFPGVVKICFKVAKV